MTEHDAKVMGLYPQEIWGECACGWRGKYRFVTAMSTATEKALKDCNRHLRKVSKMEMFG